MENSKAPMVSPLAAIRSKERALAEQIEAAQTSAHATVSDALARAAAIKQQAEREGLADAEALYQDGLARAKEEAAALVRDGEAEARQERQAGLSHMDAAVNYIVSFVLPRPSADA